jgi:hypothetical protein
MDILADSEAIRRTEATHLMDTVAIISGNKKKREIIHL